MLPKSVLDDLRKSGLTSADAQKLQIKYIPAIEMVKKFPRVKVDAYEIPYFNIIGEKTNFSRYKLLGSHFSPESNRLIKYLQVKGTVPGFYYPPFLSWAKIAADKTIPIYLTEGEKKAAAMCKRGRPCVGMGGVWNWLTQEDR